MPTKSSDCLGNRSSFTEASNAADPFELEILTPEKADVYLSCSEGSQLSWQLTRLLDEASIRVVGDLPEPYTNGDRMRHIVAGCAGVVSVLACQPSSRAMDARLLAELSQGAALGLPLAIFADKSVHLDLDEHEDRLRLRVGGSEPLLIRSDRLHGPVVYLGDTFERDIQATATRFQSRLLRDRTRIRPYAFFVGRLERDFAQAREAIRATVESETGIPFLWSDDGRHLTNVASVRERTRLLIKHASFVIADLTLGFENPQHENPSRAHEIGMAIAYGRHIMLCSQEPRRHPYFSVGDMQMTFWANEGELADHVKSWIHTHRGVVVRQVFNHHLEAVFPLYKSHIERSVFNFDPACRYVGPATEVQHHLRKSIPLFVGVVVILLVLAMLTLVLAS